MLIQEEVNEAQSEYHLYLAGFLPSQMVKLRTGRIFCGINQLLYAGGMGAYLELLNQKSIGKKFACSPSQSEINFTPLNHDIHADNYIQYYRDLMALQIKLGDDYVEKGELEAAITAYHQALNLSHHSADDVQIYYKIGLARQQMHDYEGAISDYLNAVVINPNYAPAYQKMGLARYQIGDYEGALADYTYAIQINPRDILSYINRAYARSQLHDHQGAIEDYTYAIQLQSYTPVTDTNQSNQHQEIIDQILANIEINPTTTAEYKQRAHSRYDLGDYEGAIADYTQASQIHPSDADTYYQRGKIHHERGDKYTALEDLNRSIQLDSHQPDAYYLRGEIHDTNGNKQLALADMHRAAEIYRHQGKLGEHKKVRDRILELDIEQSLDSLNF